MTGVQAVGGSGTHIAGLDLDRYHELRTFVRMGVLQPTLWVSHSSWMADDSPRQIDVLGIGAGIGAVARHRGATFEIVAGATRRSLQTECTIARGDPPRSCIARPRWSPQLRLAMSAEHNKPAGVFAAGPELVAEIVEHADGTRGVLVLAGIMMTGGLRWAGR